MQWIIFYLAFSSIYATQSDIRIVGGKQATIEKVPYLVMVICQRMFITTRCGGVLLNKKTVLTAAHCVLVCSKDDLIVIAGSTTGDMKYGHKVNSITIHPKYHEVDNDIAVLCLQFTLKYSERIQPISIANQLYPEGTNATVSGWGVTNDNDDKKKVELRIVDVQLINNHHCNFFDPLLTERQLCSANDGHGPCRGDSGGPLTTHDKLIGIVSYGDKKCTAKMVRVYTNVYSFRRFIQDNTC